jgi:hypothetical protein
MKPPMKVDMAQLCLLHYMDWIWTNVTDDVSELLEQVQEILHASK